MAGDGLHMNAAGYGIVADQLVARIDDVLGIQPREQHAERVA